MGAEDGWLMGVLINDDDGYELLEANAEELYSVSEGKEGRSA